MKPLLPKSLLICLALVGLPEPAQAKPLWPDGTLAQQEEQRDLRARILAIAEQYAKLRWHASEKNVLHGKDQDGTRVDTPDVSFDEKGWKPDGEENIGMPYAWGGFTSIEQFQASIDRGMLAGHIPKVERARASQHAVGVDCSGFVSRCWDLPRKQSTRSLVGLCYELDGYGDLLPGDIVNHFDGHVVLFKEWVDAERTEMRVYEAGRLRVEESVYDIALLKARNFIPMRYKPLDSRWVPMQLDKPSFESEDMSESGRWIPGDGESMEVTLNELVSPLQNSVPLEWVRYRIKNARPGSIPSIDTRMVASRTGDSLELQTVSWIAGKELMTGRESSRHSDWLDMLLEFTGISEPLRDFRLTEGHAEAGIFEYAGRRFSAYKIRAILKGEVEMRHTRYPLTIHIDGYLSDEVPLHGFLEADLRLDFTWRETEDSEPVVIETRSSYRMIAFGKP